MRKLKLRIFIGKFPEFAIKKTDLYLFKNWKIMTKVIMSSVTYGVLLMAKVLCQV